MSTGVVVGGGDVVDLDTVSRRNERCPGEANVKEGRQSLGHKGKCCYEYQVLLPASLTRFVSFFTKNYRYWYEGTWTHHSVTTSSSPPI
jgi:hypothetical protein